MPLSDEDGAALIAESEREKKDLERVKRELKRMRWEKELQKRGLERLQYEVELEWLQYEAELEWLQPENVEMPMFPLLQGPQQSAPTAVALAAETLVAEAMTGTRVLPDTAASDASVERAVIELTSAAGTCSEICRERGTSNHPFDPGTVLPLAVRYHNSSWPKHGSNSNSSNSSKSSGNGSSSSSNDTTSNHDSWWDTTCVVALLRPFDPGKGCQRDVRRGRAALVVDIPFDRGKSWGRMQHGG